MFLPDNIDLAQSEKYCLSIRLTPNGFSFLIFLYADKSIFYFNEIAFSKNLSAIENLKKIFFEANLFAHQYKSITVNIVSPRYTVVPNSLFEKGNVIDYFNFNIHGDTGKVLSSYVEQGDYNIVWDMSEEKYSFLFRSLWNAQFTNFTTHLLSFYHNHGNENKKRCFIDFDINMVTISCFEDDQLRSVNTFVSNSKYDTIYYIVNIWDKHPLDQNNDFLYISGDIKNNWETIDILKKLIRNVHEIHLPLPIKVRDYKKNIPTDLLIQLCE